MEPLGERDELLQRIRAANALRPGPSRSFEDDRDDRIRRASTRLAVYGSLRPGGENHHLVGDLRGEWAVGRVRGVLLPGGGEGIERYPMLTLDESGAEVKVDLLESEGLLERWEELDSFEAPAYRRQLAVVELEEGRLAVASVYAKPTDVEG
jgi:gamma-glutamylcyclotransferase (GGCT)/AIG2-like uncharacterized protein YtfP